jgi:hypothetical protein
MEKPNKPIRETYRLFLCSRCRRQVSICATCDRGQRYCGKECSEQRRREGLRAAGKRYQLSPQGRERHAERQARYREARLAARVAREEVTHHGDPNAEPCFRQVDALPACRPESPLPSVPPFVACTLCGATCWPYARFDSLREGRRRKAGRRLYMRSTGLQLRGRLRTARFAI